MIIPSKASPLIPTSHTLAQALTSASYLSAKAETCCHFKIFSKHLDKCSCDIR